MQPNPQVVPTLAPWAPLGDFMGPLKDSSTDRGEDGALISVNDRIGSPEKGRVRESLDTDLALGNGEVSIAEEARLKVAQVESLYLFKDRREVLSFLESYPFLFDILIQAHEQIENYFGYGATVELKVFVDPEDADDEGMLYASIKTRLCADEAHSTITAFEQEWWLDRLCLARGNICITLSFV